MEYTWLLTIHDRHGCQPRRGAFQSKEKAEEALYGFVKSVWERAYPIPRNREDAIRAHFEDQKHRYGDYGDFYQLETWSTGVLVPLVELVVERSDSLGY